MAEPLNDLDEEVLNTFLFEETQPLGEYRLQAQSASDGAERIRLLAAIGARTYQAALLSYGLRNSAAVIRFFREAIDARRELFQSPLAHEDKTPVVLIETIYAAIILDDWHAATQLANLQQYSPETYDDGEFVADTAIMGYIVAFQEAVKQDFGQALRIAATNIERNRERKQGFVKHVLLNTEALRAVAASEVPAFDQALDRILHEHALEASRGRLRESPEGLLCLAGLGLSGLARRRGIHVESDSFYLPLSLLDL